ncbi:MAG: integrin alpha, partial [Planctomycetota bacterium]
RIVSGADWSTRALWSYGDDRAKFGSALASVRDMSLDDRRDVAVGAPGLQNSSDDSEGRVYFLNANAFLTPPLLNTLTDGIAGNGFGASLLEVGDITGGTGSELLVGAMNFIAVLEGATFNFYVDQRAGELTLFELDSFQPLWKNSGQGAKLIDSRSMALGHVTGGGTEVVVLESWTTSSLPRIATLRLIDGAVTRRLDGAAAERSQHHSLAVVPSPNPDLRDSVVFGVPSMDFRGGILTYNIVESPPPTPPTQTWTVNADPGAGADFVGMVQASVIAAPGDTLLVAPGAYDYTGISRDLILLKDGSQPGAVFTLWLEVKEASRCHVEGFSPNRLSLGEISFRGTVEAVAALEIEVIDCNDMTVANCTFGPGDPGIEVVASYLQVRSTSASGGLLFTPGGGVGYYAMDVSGFGQVLAVDSQFYGADSAMGPPPFGSQTETSEAVRLGEFTHLDLRGDPSALLEGGTDPMGLVAPSRDLLIAPTATASISSSHQGVSWEGGGAVTLESDISPWLEYASSVDAGGTWDVVVRAELGVPVAFYVTAEPSFVTVPSLLGTPLLLDIATEIASTLETGAGLSTVQPTPSFPIPANPALVGLQLHLQGFVVRPDFLFEGTNGGALLIR